METAGGLAESQLAERTVWKVVMPSVGQMDCVDAGGRDCCRDRLLQQQRCRCACGSVLHSCVCLLLCTDEVMQVCLQC